MRQDLFCNGVIVWIVDGIAFAQIWKQITLFLVGRAANTLAHWAELQRSISYSIPDLAPSTGAARQAFDGNLVALAQPITSSIDVDERVVRIEVRLPGLLGIFSGLIASRVKRGATLLIEPPRS